MGLQRRYKEEEDIDEIDKKPQVNVQQKDGEQLIIQENFYDDVYEPEEPVIKNLMNAPFSFTSANQENVSESLLKPPKRNYSPVK